VNIFVILGNLLAKLGLAGVVAMHEL